MRRLTRLFLIVIAFALIAPVTSAEEYFGEFLDSLKGTFNVRANPRPSFKISDEFRFRDPNTLLWTTPKGTEVDGASIPQAFWSVIGGPFEGQYINASVIHDHYCRTKERTAHDTHRNLYYGMRASGVPGWKASLMYWAVSTFGPSWILEQRWVMAMNCSDRLFSPPTCTSVPHSQKVLVEMPPIDLSDPAVLAAAITKANAVARTLLTSNGEIIDIGAAGTVPATIEAVAANAAFYPGFPI